MAYGLAICAARELREETGLTLGEPPDLDGLHYLARAVTPPKLPIRFNARFLVVHEDRVSGTLGGDGELDNLRYYGLTEALALIVTDGGLRSDSADLERNMSWASSALRSVRDIGWALAVGCIGVGIAVLIRLSRPKAATGLPGGSNEASGG